MRGWGLSDRVAGWATLFGAANCALVYVLGTLGISNTDLAAEVWTRWLFESLRIVSVILFAVGIWLLLEKPRQDR